MHKSIFLLFVLTLSSCKSNLWEKDIPIFPPAIEGKVIQKYRKSESGRPLNHIVIKNKNDSIYDLSWIHYVYYDSCLVNDSVYKGDSSMYFFFYRNNKPVYEMNLNSPEIFNYYLKPYSDK
jgi:hypothetical protein